MVGGDYGPAAIGAILALAGLVVTAWFFRTMDERRSNLTLW